MALIVLAILKKYRRQAIIHPVPTQVHGGRGIKVNFFAQICSVLEAKFDDIT